MAWSERRIAPGRAGARYEVDCWRYCARVARSRPSSSIALEPGLGRLTDGDAGRERGVDSFTDIHTDGGGSRLGILLPAVGLGMALAAQVVVVDDPAFATLPSLLVQMRLRTATVDLREQLGEIDFDLQHRVAQGPLGAHRSGPRLRQSRRRPLAPALAVRPFLRAACHCAASASTTGMMLFRKRE